MVIFVVPTIRNVPQEGHQTDPEIQDDIKVHFRFHVRGKSSFDLFAGSENHESHECIDDISNTVVQFSNCRFDVLNTQDIPGNDANNTTPAKSDSTAIEETHVETICSSLDFCENLSIVLRNTSGQCLAPLLHLV